MTGLVKIHTRKKGRSFEERFLAFALPEPNSGCWLWVGACYGSGYGVFNRKHAHRASWELFCGAIPEGLIVCHKCDTRCCVNPEHLFVGTYADNANDMYAKGRGNNPCGERHRKARLSESDIASIRADPRRLREIGADYGVDRSYIWKIKRGWHWGHSHSETAVDDAVVRHASQYLYQAKGETHSSAVLTEAQVRNVLTDPRSGAELARLYGVTKTTINRIRRRKTWRHICV